MSRVLLIGDTHNRIDTLKRILFDYPKKGGRRINTCDYVVHVGDWFDSFNDTPKHAENTALYIKWLIENIGLKFKFCIGNHDQSYIAPNGGTYSGMFGHTKKKHEAVKRILHREHWDKFEFYHAIDGWIVSHAGITEQVFCKPYQSLTEENLKRVCDEAKKTLFGGLYHPVYGMGASRGGFAPCGGITWADWIEDFTPIPGIKQVVGHTRVTRPQVKNVYGTDSGESWNIDCMPRTVGWLIDGKFESEDTGIEPSY